MIDQVISDYKSGMASADISARYNISLYKIYNVLRDAGIQLINNRYKAGYRPHNKQPIDDADIKQLHSHGMQTKDIAIKLGCSTATIHQRLKSIGLKSNHFTYDKCTNIISQIGQVAYDCLNNYDWIYEQYIIKNKPTRVIASELKCGKKTISTFLKKHKIPIKRSRRGLFKSSTDKCKDFWYDSYWEYQIATHFDNDIMVYKFIKEPFPIDYIDKNNKHRKYYLDFMVVLTDGKIFLIEVKPDGLLPYVESKIQAAHKSKFSFYVLNNTDKMPWEI